ncbi:MAG: PP0621 family protein [Gammaproteobacteria bacterium]|nr:PP0621 family protein [Gammaproteobacteria bacterium]
MFRSLIVFIAIGVIVWLVSRMLSNKRNTPRSKTGASNPHEIKKIVQCQQCQVFIPEDKAIKSENFSFCSQQHLEQWTQDQ